MERAYSLLLQLKLNLVCCMMFFLCAGLIMSTAKSLELQTTGYLRIWIVIFTVVTLQMSTTLRPLIGTSPDLLPTEKRFFLQHWLEQFNDENMAVRQK